MSIREKAELHWKYTEQLIRKSLDNIDRIDEKWIMICHYLYVEAIVHGYKHRQDEIQNAYKNLLRDT